MEDEIQAASSGIESTESVNPGNVASPGTGTRIEPAPPPARPSGLGGGAATGKRTLSEAQRANLAKGRATQAANRGTGQKRGPYKKTAGAASGKATPKSSPTKTGGTGGAARPTAANEPIREFLVDQPLDVPLSVDAPKVDIFGMVRSMLAMIADIHAMNKPLLDDTVVTFIANAQQAGGIRPTIREAGGQNFLRQMWQFQPEEIDSLAIPITNMIPDMPVRAQKALEKWSNPLALLGTAYMLIVPRINSERQLINAIRTFDAGFATTAQPRGTNPGTPSGASAPNTKVESDQFEVPKPTPPGG